jgi:hypothetical protein
LREHLGEDDYEQIRMKFQLINSRTEISEHIKDFLKIIFPPQDEKIDTASKEFNLKLGWVSEMMDGFKYSHKKAQFKSGMEKYLFPNKDLNLI